MTSAELDNLVRIGKLKREPPSARELARSLIAASLRPSDRGRPHRNPDHFPIQNRLKITPSRSSAVNSPVISFNRS